MANQDMVLANDPRAILGPLDRCMVRSVEFWPEEFQLLRRKTPSMTNLYEIDPERRALYGFRYGSSAYRGWFDSLFEDYSIYPYLNILRDETRQLLYRKTLLSKLVPIFSKQLRITTVLNKIIGIDLLSNKSEGPGLVEELATVLVQEAESRKTLNSQLADLEKRLRKEHKYFCGMTHGIYGRGDSPVLKDRTPAVDGSLIAAEGILNHIDAITSLNPALARTFEGTGIKWLLADFPYFELNSQNKNYDGNVLGLKIDDAIATTLMSLPFDDQIGWYPYVTVFGIFHNSMSPRYSQIKVIDWCWMKVRVAKPYDELPKLLQGFLDESAREHYVEGVEFHPWLDLNRPPDIPMFLSAIQIVNRAGNLDYGLVRNDTKALVQKGLDAAKGQIPRQIGAYFNVNVTGEQSPIR